MKLKVDGKTQVSNWKFWQPETTSRLFPVVSDSGTPLYALQELGGWESSEMVRKYTHLACEHLAPYAERLSSLRV